MTTLIVDTGLCNLDSVHRAVEQLGGNPSTSADPAGLGQAARVVLPGVGSFADAARRLEQSGFAQALQEAVADGLPLLGICLGMQLLCETGTEGGEASGLGLIPGRVTRLTPVDARERVPHVGWNEVHITRDTPLFEDVPQGQDAYFVHAYCVRPAVEDDIAATTPGYGTVVSALARGHVFGTQFHPEKSQAYGLRILENFLRF